MDNKEFRSIVAALAKRHGWREQGKSALARLFGCNRVSVQRWTDGDREVDPIAARLAYLLELHPEGVAELTERFGV